LRSPKFYFQWFWMGIVFLCKKVRKYHEISTRKKMLQKSASILCNLFATKSEHSPPVVVDVNDQ
jgi:hypothetical protein